MQKTTNQIFWISAFFVIVFSMLNISCSKKIATQELSNISDYHSYLRIEVLNAKTELIKGMNNQLMKEVFYNENETYCLKKYRLHSELYRYNSEKVAVEFFLIKEDSIYYNKTLDYDQFIKNIYSDPRSERFIKSYKINREIQKNINGFQCYQVRFEDTSNLLPQIEMFVTDKLPNLPGHYPYVPEVLNSEPIQLIFPIFQDTLKLEIVEMKKSVETIKEMDLSNNLMLNDKEFLRKMENFRRLSSEVLR